MATSLRSAFHFFACGWDPTASAINYVSAVANIFDASAIIFDASAKNFDFRQTPSVGANAPLDSPRNGDIM